MKVKIKKPAYIMMSSDYSQQEPKITAVVSGSKKLLQTFQEGKDIYATLSSVAFNRPYEECLEFHPVTHELQPEGKKLRGYGKVLVLGINYGMSVNSIAEMLFGTREDMTDDDKLKEAQKVHDSLMKGLPDLQQAIVNAQKRATELGYTETILGRRRHHPDMQLPRFEFVPMAGYMNPDVDPLDISTMTNKSAIPDRIISQLTKEFNNYKYFGQRVKRTKELAEEKIKVVDNSYKIDSASREVFNAIVQGSAADLTKMAMLKLDSDPDWKRIGGRLLIPVHDELIAEAPYEYKEEAAEILARCMCEAGSFFPFPLTCDVETTFRWYGLSVEDIESFDKPCNLDPDSMTESNIKWIQAMLVENEFILPKYNGPDGSKPVGIASEGVNGIWSTEVERSIASYKSRYQISSDDAFISHIDRKVKTGVIS